MHSYFTIFACKQFFKKKNTFNFRIFKIEKYNIFISGPKERLCKYIFDIPCFCVGGVCRGGGGVGVVKAVGEVEVKSVVVGAGRRELNQWGGGGEEGELTEKIPLFLSDWISFSSYLADFIS